jgi:hypothetical protein
MIKHKHTDQCLVYAAVTGKSFCIADCKDTRVTTEARLRECVHAILKLPEPPAWLGDGPDERVGHILAHAERLNAECDAVTEDCSQLIDGRNEVIADLERDLGERNNQYHMTCAKVLSREALIKGLADDCNELEQTNKRLENQVFSYQLDADGGRISWKELEADTDMIRITLEEELKKMEIRAQAAELAGDALQTMYEEAKEQVKDLVDNEKVTFMDASFDIKQRLVVAEKLLADMRERAERIVEGEEWNLVSFVLRKTDHIHKPECWKNQAFSYLGVGGRHASCTCR